MRGGRRRWCRRVRLLAGGALDRWQAPGAAQSSIEACGMHVGLVGGFGSMGLAGAPRRGAACRGRSVAATPRRRPCPIPTCAPLTSAVCVTSAGLGGRIGGPPQAGRRRQRRSCTAVAEAAWRVPFGQSTAPGAFTHPPVLHSWFEGLQGHGDPKLGGRQPLLSGCTPQMASNGPQSTAPPAEGQQHSSNGVQQRENGPAREHEVADCIVVGTGAAGSLGL